MGGRWVIGLAWLGIVPIACTTLLGDDFVILVTGDGGASTASSASGQGASGGSVANGGTGGSAIGAPCDAALQDCPEGLKCLPQDPPPGICAANGSLVEGTACTASHPNGDSDDCGAGLLCVQGTCHRLCDVSMAICSDGMSSCMTVVGNASVCVPWCDPLLQQCANDEGCYFLEPSFICAPAPSNLGEGQECFFINDCAPGLACVTASACGLSHDCCKPFCDSTLPASMYCSGSDMCTALGAPAPYDDVGVCIVP